MESCELQYPQSPKLEILLRASINTDDVCEEG